MTSITRRQFVQQAALAVPALYRCPSLAVLKGHAQGTADKPAPVDAASLRKLASEIRGRVITPETPDYESARLVFNRAFDRRPAVIVRCAGPSDVARTLDFAQSRKLPLAVRGGGHSRLGFGICDGGAVI